MFEGTWVFVNQDAQIKNECGSHAQCSVKCEQVNYEIHLIPLIYQIVMCEGLGKRSYQEIIKWV